MQTRSFHLQNVKKVRCKYWFHLIKHTPSIRFITSCFSLISLFFGWLFLFGVRFYFFKLMVNKVFNSILETCEVFKNVFSLTKANNISKQVQKLLNISTITNFFHIRIFSIYQVRTCLIPLA